MIRVKIINGAAVDVEELQYGHWRLHSRWRLFVRLWNRYLTDSFQVVTIDPIRLNYSEGEEYWGYPFGNGKICLIEKIAEQYRSA